MKLEEKNEEIRRRVEARHATGKISAVAIQNSSIPLPIAELERQPKGVFQIVFRLFYLSADHVARLLFSALT